MTKRPGIRSGKEMGFPYSLSRWTDVPGSADKWAWFLANMAQGHMIAFDPTTAVPSRWSLRADDTLGLIFWTKDPTNLIFESNRFEGYQVKVHVTVTGWEEVEKGAPSLRSGADKLGMAASIFGPENVTWRFSPVPMVPDVVQRFDTIAAMASYRGLKRVYLSFLQENDRLPETRSEQERLNILAQVAELGQKHGIQVLLCNEDRLLAKYPELHPNLAFGICAPAEGFALPLGVKTVSEGCGCVLMVDPFTINESCQIGCKYCYASDQALTPKKRNTTRSLPVLR